MPSALPSLLAASPLRGEEVAADRAVDVEILGRSALAGRVDHARHALAEKALHPGAAGARVLHRQQVLEPGELFVAQLEEAAAIRVGDQDALHAPTVAGIVRLGFNGRTRWTTRARSRRSATRCRRHCATPTSTPAPTGRCRAPASAPPASGSLTSSPRVGSRPGA